MTPAKATDVLLHAAAILKHLSSAYKFVVVGDRKGSQGDRLMELRDSLGLREQVIFAGFREDIPRAMAAFDLYALTSRSEGFSIALVEAMASGVPAVATRCGGPEEIIDDEVSGILVENASAIAVAAAIERLRNSTRERQLLSSAGREVVRQKYSVAAHVSAYESIYDELTAPTRNAH